MISSKHPIIAHGELYVKTITKKSGGGTPDIPHTYEVAKHRLTTDIDRIFQAIQEKQEVFLNEKIMCVRMEPKFEAKSYVPTQLSTDDGMNIVGGRKYSFTDNAEIKQDAKLYFLKTDDKGIRNLKETLTSGAKDNVEAWRNQIGSIHSLDLLKPEEKIMGFSEEWEKGTVEIVLHPIENEHDRMLELFYSTSKIPEKDTRVKTYKDGLTFISAKCSRVELDNIKRFNPLRAIHPLGKIDLSPVRMFSGESAPQLLSSNKKSSIIVGVFDGGVDETNSLLNGHVKETDCVPTTPTVHYLEHGTAVCGAVLHGNLVRKNKLGMLPVPCVSVASYRVFPVQDPDDLELYEIIDVIEQVVSSRPDISLYNLSFGPSGAIIDDSINRFTYVLDRLTYELHENARNPLFCVAVGNDGYLIEPLNRIQSPADMVNGLGVGAYSYQAGSKIRAPYSCVGCGREG
ncbi:MAG: S8 family peptidase, partial [Candidatus Bathyarchaeota archaeon]|nr:S8 family peptidase [Candidatus Termiticorpusculum sp.]